MQNTLWRNFEHTLNSKYYFSFLKNTSVSKKQAICNKAIEFAISSNNFNTTLQFLFDVKAVHELATFVANNLDKLHTYSFSLYRNISNFLFKQQQALAAIQIRRQLALSVIKAKKSSYYEDAISDLKKARDFSKDVTCWLDVIKHKPFMLKLYEEHKRKHSLWRRCKEASLAFE